MSDFLASGLYLNTVYALGFACTVAAISICVGVIWIASSCFSQEVCQERDDPWRHRILLLWRDSFIVTLLFLVDSYAYRASDFISGSGRIALEDVQPLLLALQVAQTIAVVILTFIAIRRLKALIQWLGEDRVRYAVASKAPAGTEADE